MRKTHLEGQMLQVMSNAVVLLGFRETASVNENTDGRGFTELLLGCNLSTELEIMHKKFYSV